MIFLVLKSWLSDFRIFKEHCQICLPCPPSVINVISQFWVTSWEELFVGYKCHEPQVYRDLIPWFFKRQAELLLLWFYFSMKWTFQKWTFQKWTLFTIKVSITYSDGQWVDFLILKKKTLLIPGPGGAGMLSESLLYRFYVVEHMKKEKRKICSVV